jgi:hypothetical protein
MRDSSELPSGSLDGVPKLCPHSDAKTAGLRSSRSRAFAAFEFVFRAAAFPRRPARNGGARARRSLVGQRLLRRNTF